MWWCINPGMTPATVSQEKKGIFTCGYSIPSVVFAPASFREKSCHIMLNLNVSASAGFLQTNLKRALCGNGGRNCIKKNSPANGLTPVHRLPPTVPGVKVKKSHTPGKTNQSNSGKAVWSTIGEGGRSQGWVVDISVCPCCNFPNSSRDLASNSLSSQSCLSRELLFQFVTLTNAYQGSQWSQAARQDSPKSAPMVLLLCSSDAWVPRGQQRRFCVWEAAAVEELLVPWT